ncbi:MAG: hypothetical protein XD43_1226 [Thermococcales archaeon 44_46]|nr:DUF3368 domain-containing protein [Thermococcus sp. 101 C5]KUJ99114.1 MAG: hypothetical protein XD43_1226 [Thermococcales archaeon 44_46]MPW38241.1 DUF3368 domain-containing protein [Thermococcus sp. 101 C5]HIH72677.1 DUF3368 domain-containing protein [Thermococcaceae archaeon]
MRNWPRGDSTPLTHLAKIGRLELLREFFGEIIIPEAVYRECVLEGGESEDARAIKNAGWIKVEKISDERLKRTLMLELDEGESEAIVLALEKNAELILIDDYDGREVARALGLRVVGTIGILLRAKFRGEIESLKDELEKLKATGFWLSEELYERILREAGEV